MLNTSVSILAIVTTVITVTKVTSVTMVARVTIDTIVPIVTSKKCAIISIPYSFSGSQRLPSK